ncbi:NADH:flavin oxidoreductase/NADH oxidase [Desulfuromonas acetoxidans]|uniref:NADH:flavin oxidoreductase/NADH oxidase n=1 Tax=Desulfuromonas acetoxidans (strain DSM 684 / 11070) TaxID=281689 RepID=Q1JVF7_DESA6|nr:NADH:flavin oxidoreductase/NADH oxidase [Desulfuromonas acetoxidans]EAT14223.1 NADH:flavin oxidoreductase/NADH oxidase [Desulfuromonas acetoxidans DSM 684]MBF0645602.1 NADH:flavin oxidoreductase/NADH oxidase [Desulfuromonas acetoxidans]NVD24349.1 NADH:flavin oxidoreductase/NADH oxidase [Desulfuromonas acetoxidans]NVE14880.1 NADH:flavin oxidoreductase/NADH oxidase [Desulfuromonas acetoxidans]
MSTLLSQGTIGNVALRNRVVMPPMCMYQSDDTAQVKDFHKYHYTARALGGIGLIVVEATGIEGRGRISDYDLGIWTDAQMRTHKELVDECHKFGAKMALQIAHAGRKSEVKTTIPVAPSAIAFSQEVPYKKPEALTLEGIEEIKELFADAAVRAQNAGYDIIELHAAHGYLLCEFLSPLTNQRQDRYGGSLENRCRIVLETVKAIKEKVDIPLMVRISADEWMENGWKVEDSIYLSKELEKIGVAAMHISAGGNHEVVDHLPAFEPLYQCDYAQKIKQAVSIPVIAVGLITTPQQGEGILKNGMCDFVAYGRELLRSPNFVFQAAKLFEEKDHIEQSYLRAY